MLIDLAAASHTSSILQFDVLCTHTHTHTAWVPLALAKMQCFGRSSANLENPFFLLGNFCFNSYVVHLSQVVKKQSLLNVHSLTFKFH